MCMEPFSVSRSIEGECPGITQTAAHHTHGRHRGEFTVQSVLTLMTLFIGTSCTSITMC